MKICLRRAAHISAERLISVQTDMQTNIDMDTDIDTDMDMDMEIGDKSIYTGLLASRDQ
jgi:hypothetical protein